MFEVGNILGEGDVRLLNDRVNCNARNVCVWLYLCAERL